MKRENIKTYSAEDLHTMAKRGKDRTNFARIDSMTEADLEQAIADDPDWRDVPRDWYHGADAVMPRAKVPVSIRLDADLVEFFRGHGRGWQTKMNAVLRAYANAMQDEKVG